MGTEGDREPNPGAPASRPSRPTTGQTRPLRARAAAGGNGQPSSEPPAHRLRPPRDPDGPGAAPGPARAEPPSGDATPPSGQPAVGDRRRLRYRVLPRSLLGITALILAFAVGAGFSGVVLYSYYQYHLDQTDNRVNALINGYKKQFANAEGDLRASANAAKSQIQTQLAPLQQLEADPKALAALVRTASPSLYFVHTQDVNGQPSVGTAFVVASNSSQSLLLTSATTVAAAGHSPAPAVYLRKNGTDTQVSVRTVDPTYDLALIVLSQGNLPVLKVAPPSADPHLGDKVYALSGLGTAGAAVSEGAVTDVSTNGVTENAPIGQAYQGGPIVNSSGQVVAIASLTYAPQGFASTGVYNAPFPQAACAKVLSCPGGSLAASQ